MVFGGGCAEAWVLLRMLVFKAEMAVVNGDIDSFIKDLDKNSRFPQYVLRLRIFSPISVDDFSFFSEVSAPRHNPRREPPPISPLP